MTENELREMAINLTDTLVLEREVNGQSVAYSEWATMMIVSALLKAKEVGERRERERCRMIRPEPDIEEVTDAYSDGYTEGFADACSRFRAAVNPSIWYGDTRPVDEIRRDEAERQAIRQDTGR
jgi:hypothetical protein